jgi:DNA-binding Lrp family transcriptional regulator
MKKERMHLNIKCSECGKNLVFLSGYRHPIEGRKKCVCASCWDMLEKSEKKYTNFIHNAISSRKTGVTCFVMINAKPKYEKKVCNTLVKFPEIVEIHQLLGKHDIIAKVEVKDYENLDSFVLNNIRRINGIKSTTTLTGTFSLTG